MSLSEVSNVLWRERRLLELLALKLQEEQLVRPSGQTRALARAGREIDGVVDEIKRVRLERAIALTDVIAELGLADAPTVRAIAACAPPPWNGIYAEHDRAIATLSREIETMRAVPERPLVLRLDEDRR